MLEGKLNLETPGHANMVFRACGDEDEEINTRAERVVLQLSRRWGEDPTRQFVPGAHNAHNFCYGEALLAMFLYPSQVSPTLYRDQRVTQRTVPTGFRTMMRATQLWLSGDPESAREMFRDWVVNVAKVYGPNCMGNPHEVVERFTQDGDDAHVDPILLFRRTVKQACEEGCHASRALEDNRFASRMPLRGRPSGWDSSTRHWPSTFTPATTSCKTRRRSQ